MANTDSMKAHVGRGEVVIYDSNGKIIANLTSSWQLFNLLRATGIKVEY